MKQKVLRKLAIATSTIAFAALLTVGWSVESAQARRLYVTPYHYNPYNPYIADQSGLSWYAVRAFYAGGPWCGVGGSVGFGYGGPGLNNWTCYSGWADYAQRNGIGCTPGTLIKGGDGIMYVCQ
jgi:hypothetical protein